MQGRRLLGFRATALLFPSTLCGAQVSPSLWSRAGGEQAGLAHRLLGWCPTPGASSLPSRFRAGVSFSATHRIPHADNTVSDSGFCIILGTASALGRDSFLLSLHVHPCPQLPTLSGVGRERVSSGLGAKASFPSSILGPPLVHCLELLITPLRRWVSAGSQLPTPVGL